VSAPCAWGSYVHSHAIWRRSKSSATRDADAGVGGFLPRASDRGDPWAGECRCNDLVSLSARLGNLRRAEVCAETSRVHSLTRAAGVSLYLLQRSPPFMARTERRALRQCPTDRGLSTGLANVRFYLKLFYDQLTRPRTTLTWDQWQKNSCCGPIADGRGSSWARLIYSSTAGSCG